MAAVVLLNGVLHVHGKQGHVAYPHLARNPIHEASSCLSRVMPNCLGQWK